MAFRKPKPSDELRGKIMLVVGLTGVGTEVSRRAHAFGMQVGAIDARELERPKFIFSLDKPAKLMERLAEADVVVLACPLTNETRGLMGNDQFRAMKKAAYFVNVESDDLVNRPALEEALQNQTIAGAGLGGINHRNPSVANLVINPHVDRPSPAGQDRQWRLFRENIRRFVAGEALLEVVDKSNGF